jgi:hypothetical protein
MKRPSLIRQTYTTASLVAMIPAAIWAAVAYHSNTFFGAVGSFPYYYLVFCQVLMLPRYVFAAWAVTYLTRYKTYDPAGGVVGFAVAGVLADAWLTAAFSRSVAQVPEEHWVGLIPLALFPYALGAMLLALTAGGFIAGSIRKNK